MVGLVCRNRLFIGLLATFAFLTASPAGAADVTEAMALFKTGSYDECAAVCQSAIDEGQYSETWRLLKIESDFKRGRFVEARSTLEDALKRYRTSIRLRWLASEVYRFTGQDTVSGEMLAQIDELTDGRSWRYSDPLSRVVLGRFNLRQGVDPKTVLREYYNAVKQRSRTFVAPYIAAGELALAKHDYALAAEEFEQALKIDGTDADVYYGLYESYASSDFEKARGFLATALERNPAHVDSMLAIADNLIDTELYDDALEMLRSALEVNVHEPRAWAMMSVIAHLQNDPIGEKVYHRTALSWWSTNPAVDQMIGEKLSANYRFREGAAYQRAALEINPDYLPAKIQLCQDLLRLGQEQAGWELAQEVYSKDGYNILAHNLLELQDSLDGFQSLQGEGFVVRMSPEEAAIYGPRVVELLTQAREVLCAKYEVELESSVLVEIFPKQEDFAIRTFGLPGGDGYLGVCFGNVITANSPASRRTSPSNWEAVLWHEFCHVVTLNKSRNKMPRWLSEGISVYEERQRNPTWGQVMIPAYRELILGDGLAPVSQLSGAFLNPPSGMHLQFAYYESSLVVEYLIDQYGPEIIPRMLADLAAGMPINDSLQRYTGSLEALDQEFAAFARARAESLGPNADWEQPSFPDGVTLQLLVEWNQDHPNNFWGLTALTQALLRARRWQEAITPLKKLVEFFPEDRSDGSARMALARVYRELKESDEERKQLDEFADLSADAVDAYARLMELAAEEEDWPEVMKQVNRSLAVNPLEAEPHRYRAQAGEALSDKTSAIEALRVLVTMEPLDPAGVHFRLAQLLFETEARAEAKIHVLKSLEEAPRYRAAHELLLKLVGPASDAAATPGVNSASGEAVLETPADTGGQEGE